MPDINIILWEKIEAFDLDHAQGEYLFSTRLAHKNYWTKNFTQQAILEYKKFMYLAATSDLMVSPSEIVDAVWHQHLIYTQSYQEFCALIGKQVQHVPSTRNKDEAEKFKQAKERTDILYKRAFGEQPVSIWQTTHIFDSLHLGKANINIRTFIIIAILVFAVLLAPFYWLLKPIYVTIGNPDFIIGYIGLLAITFIGLELFNHYKMKQITQSFSPDSFIFDLTPLELVYLKTKKIANYIHAIVNELVASHVIKVNPDNTLSHENTNLPLTIEHKQIINTLAPLGKVYYPILLQRLITKPVFRNVSNSMDAFLKYFIKSKKFGRLFYINFIVISFVLMLGLIRLSTGIIREKPVLQIAIVSAIVVSIMVMFLQRLTKLIATKTIPDYYKKEILSAELLNSDWQWNYFQFGKAVLVAQLLPLVSYVERNSRTSENESSFGISCGGGGDGGGGGGSSCGGGCGGGCGGCGGGD